MQAVAMFIILISSQPFLTLLDRKVHTAKATFERCPFLHTVSAYYFPFSLLLLDI